jgi:hypothetical protein
VRVIGSRTHAGFTVKFYPGNQPTKNAGVFGPRLFFSAAGKGRMPLRLAGRMPALHKTWARNLIEQRIEPMRQLGLLLLLCMGIGCRIG